MALLLFLFVLMAMCRFGLPSPTEALSTLLPDSRSFPLLQKRNATSLPDGPVNRNVNISTSLKGRTVLFISQNLTITCIDCELSGAFQLDVDFALNDDVANEVVSLISTALGGAASAASSVTSEIASVASDINSALGPLARIVRREARLIHRSLDDTLLQLLSNFSLSLTQITPIHGNYTLEFASGSEAFDFDLPTIAPPGLSTPGFLPASIDVGVFQFGMKFDPIALATNIKIAPNINVSFPFLVDMSLNQPLVISEQGIQNPDPDIDVEVGTPIFNQLDPSLCLNATLGPMVSFSLNIPELQVGIDLGAQLSMPGISLCLVDDKNVDMNCQTGGNITNALRIQSSLELGFTTGLHLTPDVFDLPKLPNLVRNFQLLDRCIDLDTVETSKDSSVELPISTATQTSSISLSTINQAATSVQAVATTSITTMIFVSGSESTTSSDDDLKTSQATSIVTPPIIEVVTIILDASSKSYQPSYSVSDTSGPNQITKLIADVKEPIGVVFSLPTAIADAERSNDLLSTSRRSV